GFHAAPGPLPRVLSCVNFPAFTAAPPPAPSESRASPGSPAHSLCSRHQTAASALPSADSPSSSSRCPHSAPTPGPAASGPPLPASSPEEARTDQSSVPYLSFPSATAPGPRTASSSPSLPAAAQELHPGQPPAARPYSPPPAESSSPPPRSPLSSPPAAASPAEP